MRDTLKTILSIQELDIKMIRLMRLKKQRLDELKQIDTVRKELVEQLGTKEGEIKELSEEAALYERKIEEHKEKIKKLESQQSSIKKIEEFNAITKEITLLEKEKSGFEQTLSNIVDRKNAEEELLEKTKVALKESDVSSTELEQEIEGSITQINEEGSALLEKRSELVKGADPEILAVYERLLRNKKDRVIVPLENRVCTGCHIALTAQHENLVRKGEKLVFCEHCSRIHYWAAEGGEQVEEGGALKRRRRRTSASA